MKNVNYFVCNKNSLASNSFLHFQGRKLLRFFYAYHIHCKTATIRNIQILRIKSSKFTFNCYCQLVHVGSRYIPYERKYLLNLTEYVCNIKEFRHFIVSIKIQDHLRILSKQNLSLIGFMLKIDVCLNIPFQV